MISFVQGDWFEVPIGALCEARYSVVQKKALPDNWERMSDQAKMAWGPANRATVVESINIYYRGSRLGHLTDSESFNEVRSAIQHDSPVYCEMIAPWSYDPDLGAKGHVVKIATDEWARVYFKRRGREQFLEDVRGWSFGLVIAATAGVGWLWLHLGN